MSVRNAIAALFVGVMLSGSAVMAAADQTEAPFVEGEGPPPAKPGEAWCLVRKPATYKTVTENVQVAPATTYSEIVPAKFETKEEKLLVSPEFKRGTVVPAKYKTEKFQVLVKPEQVSYEIIPAKYESAEETVIVEAESEELKTTDPILKSVAEKVMTAPAYAFWKVTKTDNGELQCFCRCEAPAKYVTVNKEVIQQEAGSEKVRHPAVTKTVRVQKLVQAAEAKKKVVPAEYVAMERRVVDAPATVTYETIPAKYETIQKQVLATPEGLKKVEIPAKFETMTRTVLDQPSHMVWRKKKCDCDEVVKKYKEIPGTDERSVRMLAKNTKDAKDTKE